MGSEHPVYHNAQRFVADQWNIEVLRVAGISVERNLADSVIIENSSLWTRLDETLKPNSKKQFQDDIGVEIRKIVKAEKTLKSNKKVKRLRRRIENREVRTYVELASKKNEWTYVYTIYSDQKNTYINNPSRREFDVIIDIENGTTELEKLDVNNVYN